MPETRGDIPYRYVYQYKDHLGNVRVNYAQQTFQGFTYLTIKEENNYYPFGLKHANYNVDYLEFQEIQDNVILYPPLSTSEKLRYNYKYNGKELQDELGLNAYDYGARNYDPAIGRWMNVDPKAETSRRWSPYTYCYNNPLVFVDPDGMMATPPDWINWKDRNGNQHITYDPQIKTVAQAEAKGYSNVKEVFESGIGKTDNTSEIFDFQKKWNVFS